MEACYILTLDKKPVQTCSQAGAADDILKKLCLHGLSGYEGLTITAVPEKQLAMEQLAEAQSRIEQIRGRKDAMLQNLFLVFADGTDVLNGCRQPIGVLYLTLIQSNHDRQTALQLPASAQVGLYHTFDHCDAVLIGNGDQISLQDYMQLLSTLKTEAHVLAITSVVGMDLTAKMPEQSGITALVDRGDCQTGSCISLLDRCSAVTLYEELSFSDLQKLLADGKGEELPEIHIGLCGQQLFGTNDPQQSEVSKALLRQSQDTFAAFERSFGEEVLKTRLNDPSYFSGYLKNIMDEMQHMILSMLERNVSLYFILILRESFYTLLSYIQDKILQKEDEAILGKQNATLMSATDLQLNAAKMRSEMILELTNRYFAYTQAITTAMFHGDRKYLQTEPYQPVLFDFPPKLVAFYTAVAEQMEQCLKTKHGSDQYNFLICPDFKPDIYIEPLTQNRDINHERNILLIHMNDKQIYHFKNTIVSLAHEIAHYVGQDGALRRERAEYYFRCLLASAFVHFFDENQTPLLTELLTSNEDAFAAFVQTVYEELFRSDLLGDESRYYYSQELEEAFMETYMRLTEQKGLTALANAFLQCYAGGETFPYDNSPQTAHERAFARQLAANTFAWKLAGQLGDPRKNQDFTRSVIDTNGNLQHLTFRPVSYLFREGYADVQMLLLTVGSAQEAGTETIASAYCSFLAPTGAEGETVGIRADLSLRMFAVLKGFAVDSMELNLDSLPPMQRICYRYLCDQAAGYFASVIQTKAQYAQEYQQVRQLMQALEAESMAKLIETMQNVLTAYQELPTASACEG